MTDAVSAEAPVPKAAVAREPIIRRLVRLLAHLLTVLLLLATAFFALYEGVPNPFMMTTREFACDGGFLLMVLGLLTAWRFERTGALAVMIGFVLFIAANFPITGRLIPESLVIFPVVAILAVLARRRRS